MCDDLVKRLRYCSEEQNGCGMCALSSDCVLRVGLLTQVADAIEELQQTADHYKRCSDDWYREACDYKAICEQMKATVIVEAQHTEMYDERDKKTLIEMAKSLPLQIIPYNDEKPRWIPVTERLPEDGQDILAVQSWDGEARIVPANYDRGLWYDCVFDYPAEHITHWMPLPEPPKEET